MAFSFQRHDPASSSPASNESVRQTATEERLGKGKTNNPFIQRMTNIEALNFLLTNRIPRHTITKLMGKFSRIEHRLVSRISIETWRLFVDDLNLKEANTQHFKSMHDCFTRSLKPGARQIDHSNNYIVSPCDAVVGAHGSIEDGQLFQIKGFPYSLRDLLGDSIDLAPYTNGRFVTLRIKSSMYHRFHAPEKCQVSKIHYISGDTWNVNPIALKRVEKLFCKNERAVIELGLEDQKEKIALVPVAAILVASMKFHALDQALDLDYKGPTRLDCQGDYQRGEEMGYFQHGSTIVVLANEHFEISETLAEGDVIRVGMPLLRRTP